MDDSEKLYAVDAMGLQTGASVWRKSLECTPRTAGKVVGISQKSANCRLNLRSNPESTAKLNVAWLIQLKEVGVEQVERWPLNEQRKDDPLKIKWTEDWLVGELIERKAVADREQDVQNWWTRGLPVVALILRA